jgi:predicted ATPase/class 3 adenylate cyclase
VECSSCGHGNREAARFCEHCGAGLTTDSAEAGAAYLSPTTVASGRYRVQRLLGEGARTRVYAALDSRLGRDVAVAIIKTEGLDDAGRHRIEREARAMARLGDHPNIVTVFDVGEDDGQPYIVSELMPGGSVADVLARQEDHRLPVDDALRIGEQVALALAHAHDRGIVDRDLKPANVWLAADGTARLGDFGLAVETDRSRITSEGMVVGTVAYLAPEQAVGRAPDTRSDLYALGACLYEMLTGRPPFLGDDAVAVISQHLNTAPVAPSWHNVAVSPGVEALVLALLAKDPAARPASATAVAAELHRLREDQVTVADGAPAAPPVSVTRSVSFGRFVGRAAELDGLKAMFDESLSGRARLVMVVGEPGIGKTRLVEELGVYATVRNAQVCWGHCYEGELGAPYLPFVEALRTYVRDRSDEELRAELSTGAPEVATLLSDLRTRFPDLPASPVLDGDAERLRLFEGVAAFLANASAARPIALMLDDLHWADKPTLLLLQYLARNLRRERILIVGTYRDVELDRAHPLADMVSALRREHLYERVLLRGFDRDEVKSFIEVVGEQETPPLFAETIHRETEGNPFFVAEILRHLAESGALRRVDGHWIGTPEGVAEHLPEGVREVIGRRLSRLGDDCNRMLTLGAAMPGGFTLEVAARVLDADEDHVLDLLDEALDRQIVRERRDQSGTYEFHHALIRQTLYSELSTPRRVRLHRQILDALESLYGANLEPRLTELAYHAFQAAPGGDVAKAVDYASRAGRRAEASAAHEEAARSYDLALQALELDDTPDEHLRAELLLSLGNAQHSAGQADARQALVHVAEIGRRLDVPELIARAAIVYAGLRLMTTGADPAMELLEEALDRRERLDDALRARLLARASVHLALLDATRHAALSEEAIEAARRSGDPGALALALYSRSLIARADTDPAIAREARLEIARLAAEAGDLTLAAESQSALVILSLFVNDRVQFDKEMAAYSRIADESRSPFVRYVETLHRASVAVFEGRYADAERLAGDALGIARRIQDRTSVQTVGAMLFPMLRELGRSAELEEPTRRVVQGFPLIAAWHTGLTLILMDEGRLDEAAMHLDELGRDGFAAVAPDVLQRYCLAGLSEVAARIGDREHAAQLYNMLEASAGFAAIIGNTAYHGAIDRYLGLLALALGRHDDAVAHHEAALAVHERMRARPWVARSWYDLSCALLHRGMAGDRERALGLLNDALDTANTLGMTKLVQEVLTAKLGLQGVASGTSITASIDVVAAAVSIDRPDLRCHAASDGTVTLLFSDIEGYTELNERLGDARTQILLRTHDALVHDAVTGHGGTVVKSQGDGFMIVFPDSDAGLACAVALQRRIAGHNFGADVGVVRVRIGLHAGQVIREGSDFYGRTVILAARIAARAAGGEILVSDALRHLRTGEFGAAREIELKGLRGAHTVHPLLW